MVFAMGDVAAQPVGSMIPTPDVSDSWPGLAGGSARPGSVMAPPPRADVRRWAAATDETGSPIAFIPQAGLASANASFGNFVFAVGRVSRPGGPMNQSRLFAFVRSTGACAWSAPLASIGLDSISSPAVDHQRGTVIIASAAQLQAFDAVAGTHAWTTDLARPVVNACPAIMPEGMGRDRLFITDFDGYGDSASLYCINIDPYDTVNNPFLPGEVVWQTPIGGSSGNSPAYLPRSLGGVGLVYVASVGAFGEQPGRVWAFDAEAVTPPEPTWVFENIIPAGFFGGVGLVRPEAPGRPPRVLAASYVFSGGLNAANLVKLDGVTGALAWSVPCNRTISTPIVLPGGRILVSGGIQGFGTVPSLRLYQDHDDHAVVLWDSALATWIDLNLNGVLDVGEYLRLGGWTQQPAVLSFAGRSIIASGVVPLGQFNQPSSDLYFLDADLSPATSAFIVGHHSGAGGSPAPAGIAIYSVGTAGLVALGPTPASLDVNADAACTIDDLYAWEDATVPGDVDGDGARTPADRAALLATFRCLHAAPIAPGGGP